MRMRHTFALRQLRRGKSPGDIARWLGVVDPNVMARYQRVLQAPVDDLA
jgi:integrase